MRNTPKSIEKELRTGKTIPSNHFMLEMSFGNINLLLGMFNAITKWQTVADQDFNERKKELIGNPGLESKYNIYDSDPILVESDILLEAKRMMWASLAVAIASTVEGTFARIYDECDIKKPSNKKRDDRRDKLEVKLSIKLDSIPGFQDAETARLLSNSFKHKEWAVDSKLAKQLSLAAGDEIEYETYDWKGIIRNTGLFLVDLSRRLPEIPR